LNGKIIIMSLSPDFINELHARTTCDIRTDPSTCWLYSTDASIYQIFPLGVAFPRTLDDLAAAVTLGAQYRIPILARGAGSSLAGQAIGAALIIDCSRYLTKIHEINAIHEGDRVVGGQITAEPGIVLNALNRAAARYSLQFGPDPASSERATLGGSLANNATGAHSILYGMSADHILSAEVVLSDGTITTFSDRMIDEDFPFMADTLESRIYTAAFNIRKTYAEAIRTHWPKVWRRASGYNLNYLLPWSPSIPPGWNPSYNPGSIYNAAVNTASRSINLAPLLAGSEGTLAVFRRATLRLVPVPKHTILGVLAYDSLEEACDAVPGLLYKHHPSAIELISQILIQLARSLPAYAPQLTWVNQVSPSGGVPAALLVVEFAGDDENILHQQVAALGPNVLFADTPELQKQVWAVRKVGLGILQSRPGDKKPATFIEDLVVPVDRLGEFVREMARIMNAHHTTGDFYAHASAGCLHFRPLLNIKTEVGITEMRSIAEEAVRLVLRLGGATSGEHGDGLSRSEWLEPAYGADILSAFRELKNAADPNGILNPGKIVNPQKMDENLRAKPSVDLAWKPVMDFTRNGGASGAKGLVGAVEMCNGAGVCRKTENVMCPSFQATKEEAFSTRGRANLLRSMMSSEPMEIQKIWESLDLCLACKGCKSECPSGVDLAKLKYEFMFHYYSSHHRRLRDYLFGYIGVIAPIGSLLAPIVNWFMSRPFLRRELERYFGLTCQRPFPRFASWSMVKKPPSIHFHQPGDTLPTILLLQDTFTHYFSPEIETAAYHILKTAGIIIVKIPIFGTGRTLISKGFLPAAKRHADRLLKAIKYIDPDGRYPVVGLEPSEIYTFLEEIPDFFPEDPYVIGLSKRAWMIDEYLIRANMNIGFSPSSNKVVLHGHCYQKSRLPAEDGFPTGVGASLDLLKLAGYTAQSIDDGCCGMAGAFGYESEHYDVSNRVGELVLFPTLRDLLHNQGKILIAAPGVSCRAQIEDGTGIKVYHPIQLIEMALQNKE
jgi:FAD/FMN-containing dehydrogenase/Fe-S oxidoreductase